MHFRSFRKEHLLIFRKCNTRLKMQNSFEENIARVSFYPINVSLQHIVFILKPSRKHASRALHTSYSLKAGNVMRWSNWPEARGGSVRKYSQPFFICGDTCFCNKISLCHRMLCAVDVTRIREMSKTIRQKVLDFVPLCRRLYDIHGSIFFSHRSIKVLRSLIMQSTSPRRKNRQNGQQVQRIG